MRAKSGDAWVEGPGGARYWGRFGAAGLLAVSPQREVLLQHRAHWSHFGGTWGMPGGARHEHESAVDAAVREAGEEAGVPPDLLVVRFTSVLDLGYWSYTTVVADVTERFEPVVSDPESIELRWVAVDRVAELDLHPRFAESWPALASQV
jgi:8-oxo-dGTP pyrophosphatase MutT (NUDIX family)